MTWHQKAVDMKQMSWADLMEIPAHVLDPSDP